MITFILLWIIYSMLEGFDHAWYNNINHSRATLRRLGLGLVIGYCKCGVGSSYVLYINTAVLMMVTFSIFFDISRNLAKGEKWYYTGSIASLDKLETKHRVLAWSAKIFLFIISVAVQLYHNTYLVHHDLLINTTWLF